MNRTVRVLKRAQRDLQELFELVSREAPLHANRWIDSMLGAIESLATMADRGARPRDDTLRDKGFRFLVRGDYLVFYKVVRTQVRVYRVLHGKRAYRGLL